MVLRRSYDGCAVLRLEESAAILAAFVLPGGRHLSSKKAAAASSDSQLAAAARNAHSESIPLAVGARLSNVRTKSTFR